jgi:CHAD domain-containing protein
MSHTGKWIEGIEPGSDVAEAARIALRERLAAVIYWLPAAAYCAEHDVEHVHRLRVGTRRAMAAWRLFRDWLPQKRARRIKKWLQKIRTTAGEARDLDVLAERLQRELGDDARDILAEISKHRAKVQPDIIRLADRARRRDRLARRIDKLITGIKPCCNGRTCDECAPFQAWAKKKLAEIAGDFFDELPTEDAEPAELHQFRIRAKALRYAIELLAPAFPPDLREVHYPVVEELQERLGQINDHATAAARLTDWAQHDQAIRDRLIKLAGRESHRLAEELPEFRAWWTANRMMSLRDALTEDSPRRERTVLA